MNFDEELLFGEKSTPFESGFFVNLNGTNQDGDFGDIPTLEFNDFIFRCQAELTSLSGIFSIFSWQCNTFTDSRRSGGYIRWVDGLISIYFNNTSFTAAGVNQESVSSTPHDVLVVKNGTTVKMWVNDLLRFGNTCPATVDYSGTDVKTALGSRYAGSSAIWGKGKYNKLVFCEYSEENLTKVQNGVLVGGTALEVPINEGIGSTISDTNQGNNGTLRNYSPSQWVAA